MVTFTVLCNCDWKLVCNILGPVIYLKVFTKKLPWVILI